MPSERHDRGSRIKDQEQNVLILSEAGKPIFARYGSETEVARQCGLVQAIRTAVLGNASFGLGEIQCVQAKNICLVFMTVGCVTLVAIRTKTQEIVETEAFCRLQLEYLYAQLIFTVTDQIQSILKQNPGYDLRSTLTSNNNLLQGLLENSGYMGNAGPFLVGAVESVFPVSYKLRKRTSQVLHSIGDKTGNLAFALILVGEKLLSLVQPPYRPHQLKVSDLHLIINFVTKQPGLLNSELWLPMCLPRFNQSGFLYAYTHCLDVESETLLILISSHNTTEQFQILRSASAKMKAELGFPSMADSILTISSSTAPSPMLSQDGEAGSNTTSGQDVAWTREESFEIDDDYVTISSDIVERRSIPIDVYPALIQEIRESAGSSSLELILKAYFDSGDSALILHFLFRADVAVNKNSKKPVGTDKGCLSQCICPHPPSVPFTSSTARRRLWSHFQQLNLRLRLGSATQESCQDACDMISLDSTKVAEGAFPGIAKDCPVIGLTESPPNIHGVSYISEDEIFLAMNGRDFELYMVTSNAISVKQAAALGTKLVRRLMADEKRLFLTSPLTWKE